MPAKFGKWKARVAASRMGNIPARLLGRRSRLQRWMPWPVLLYVFAVLTVDTLAVQQVSWPIDWTFFSWYGPQVHRAITAIGGPAMDWLLHPSLTTFNWFRFLAWFVLPLLLCLRHFEWGWLGWNRWRKLDVAVLGGIIVLGAIIMGLLPHLPGVREIYPPQSHQFNAFPWDRLLNRIFWLCSWLIGWEFLHRYVLLRALEQRWKHWGWLLVPLSEGAYHLQKPLLETLGMVVFSLFLTQWARKRRNLLLPFLAHLIIEIELILYLLLF